MIPVPDGHAKLVDFTRQLIEQCRASAGKRESYYRLLHLITETGRYEGGKSLINMMFWHLNRASDHIFSPVQLRFNISFERRYPRLTLDRALVAAEVLTMLWSRNGLDVTFGQGVFEALKYGASILKQWPEETTDGRFVYRHDLVKPWNFAVYREDKNDLDSQEVLCETLPLTLPEVWQRIWQMRDATKLFARIGEHAQQGAVAAEPANFFNQVLSTSQINTTGLQAALRPGGIVQFVGDANSGFMGPMLGVPIVNMHELWVKDTPRKNKLGNYVSDYTTIQFIEPDIVIEPGVRRRNVLGLEQRHPYTLIQPNMMHGYFWGRSELIDLIEPQRMLAEWCDDARRLFGLQIDKILAFTGDAGITDELYGNSRNAGYFNLPQGAGVEDVTPQMPPDMMQMLRFAIEMVNMLGAFPELFQGKGETGVRAGVHADTLLKTGSPTLRDRSLLAEKQCANAGDLTMSFMEAKEEDFHWTKADKPLEDPENTKFLLSELPSDWHVTVDSHSSSPIFMNESGQMIFAAHRAGIVTSEYVIDNQPFPNKDVAKAQLREREQQQQATMQKLLQEEPSAATALLKKQVMGGGKR